MTVDEKLDKILEILNGNGKIGLCAKVTILWGVSLFLVVSVSGLLLRAYILR